MTTAICSLIRNEKNRFLEQILPIWSSLSDILILLDDGSDDGTSEVLEAYEGEKLLRRRASMSEAWGSESEARQELWSMAQSSNIDWLFFLDADMIPAADPRSFFSEGVDGVSFWLYDLWSTKPLRYRFDGQWQGHNWPRVWAVRNPKGDFKAEWNSRGVHCGHLPTNLKLEIVVTPPPPAGALLHYAYSTEELRLRKWHQYQTVKHQLTPPEAAHADSIVGKAWIRSLDFQPEISLA